MRSPAAIIRGASDVIVEVGAHIRSFSTARGCNNTTLVSMFLLGE